MIIMLANVDTTILQVPTSVSTTPRITLRITLARQKLETG